MPDENQPLILANRRILLVEDSLVAQQVFTRLVCGLGGKLEIVSNGLEAIRVLKNEVFDVILMDCCMPEINGYEATRQIRRLKNRNRAVPIIAITAYTGIEERERCLAAGMNDYLPKPVQMLELSETLKRWLDSGSEKSSLPDSESLLQKSDSSPSELIKLLLDDTPPRIKGVVDAITARDQHRVMDEAHGLKNSFIFFDAPELKTFCVGIEKLAESGKFEECMRQVCLLEVTFKKQAGKLRLRTVTPV